MSKKKKIAEKYILDLEEYLKAAEARKKYSLERFDILIISLSSGGLVMTLSIYSKFENVTLYSIPIAWIGFSLALIANLTSQCTGFFANKFDIDCTKIIIENERKGISNCAQIPFDIKCKRYTGITSFLNGVAFFSLIAAILSLIIFIIFKY